MQKLAELCIRRPVFATMLIVSLVVLGLAAYARLGVDLFPNIEFPTITVTTILPGASPEEVETTITQKIEETVNTIDGIDELRSVSAEGVSQVFITFLLNKEPSEAAQQVRDKVNRILNDLPDDAEIPVVEKVDTDASPVLRVAISSGQPLREMTKRVEDVIKKNIESISGVGQVRFIGDRRRQIQILIDVDKLAAFNLNIVQVREALRAQNVEIPGGRISQRERELTIRSMGRIEDPRDFNRVIVAEVQGQPIRIEDLGRVVDGYEEPRTIAQLNGEPAIVLEIRKQSGTNTVEVIKAVKGRIQELLPALPGDYKLTYVQDQSDFIEASFHAVREHLILGGLFAAFVVFLFIRNIRPTLIAAVAIPTSVVATFSLMDWMGFTLNQITMLALTLVVGIVIDDAIVVLENVFRFLEEKGLPPIRAAIEGTAEVGMAVMSTTLSLVIVFLPVAYMGGIVGKFMSSFGFTAAFAIMVSLLVSFTLTPMLCSRFLGSRSQTRGHGSREKGFFVLLDRGYKAMLRWSLSHRLIVTIFAILLSLTTVPLFLGIGKDFLPEDDQSEFEITVRTPAGSSPDGTLQILQGIEEEIKQLPHVKAYVTTVGADARQSPDRGSVLVRLDPVETRDLSQNDLMDMARGRVRNRFRQLEFSVAPSSFFSGGGFVNADLQFFIQGPDFDELNRVADTLAAELQGTPGVVDVDSTFEPGKPEIRAYILRDKAADLGMTPASIAGALRILVGGDEQVTTYREGDDRYDVMLRAEDVNRTNLAALSRLFIPSSKVGNVPLSNVVEMRPGTGPVQIDRYGRQRQVAITANILPGQSLSSVIEVLNRKVESLDLPPTIRTGLLGRSRELSRAGLAYVVAVVLALAFMYIVLAALFESFIDPITVMSTLPLSIPFALLSLYLTQENFSIIYSSLGILMLFGVVKKNAILQIDHVNYLRREHAMDRYPALLQGCGDRLRPILMTTLSLVAGMVPLAVGGGAGSGSRRSVAVIIIGGQLLCLVISLLVAPVVYSLLEDLTRPHYWKRVFGRFLPQRSSSESLESQTLKISAEAED